MPSILSYDILQLIVELLKFDRLTLLSCILSNRTLTTIAIPILWKNPYIINENINQYQLALLAKSYIACFTEIEIKYLKVKNVNIYNLRKPLFNYASYLKELIYCEPLHNSILYWILLEYRNFTKSQLINIKNIHQYKEIQIQYPLINAMYYMFINNNIKSLGISINTLKIKDQYDYLFIEKLNLTNIALTKLTIILKDYENKKIYEAFKYLLRIIAKCCCSIKYIKIYNYFVFNNQQNNLIEIQDVIIKQSKLLKLEFITPNSNIIINEILSNFTNFKCNYLTEINLQGTDLSSNSRLKGLSYITSLKSLILYNCKGISNTNVFILSESLIQLHSLKFTDNSFSLIYIVSTIGKGLIELDTNQLDYESIDIISSYSINNLLRLDIKVNLDIQNLLFQLIEKSKIIYLYIKCSEMSSLVFNDLGRHIPDSLKQLKLFINFDYKVNELENLIINCNDSLVMLEIYGSPNCNNLRRIIRNFNLNNNLKREVFLTLINNRFDCGVKIFFK
jgi:hypothetical protein